MLQAHMSMVVGMAVRRCALLRCAARHSAECRCAALCLAMLCSALLCRAAPRHAPPSLTCCSHCFTNMACCAVPQSSLRARAKSNACPRFMGVSPLCLGSLGAYPLLGSAWSMAGKAGWRLEPTPVKGRFRLRSQVRAPALTSMACWVGGWLGAFGWEPPACHLPACLPTCLPACSKDCLQAQL